MSSAFHLLKGSNLCHVALCVFSLYSSLCACFIFPNSNPWGKCLIYGKWFAKSQARHMSLGLQSVIFFGDQLHWRVQRSPCCAFVPFALWGRKCGICGDSSWRFCPSDLRASRVKGADVPWFFQFIFLILLQHQDDLNSRDLNFQTILRCSHHVPNTIKTVWRISQKRFWIQVKRLSNSIQKILEAGSV